MLHICICVVLVFHVFYFVFHLMYEKYFYKMQASSYFMPMQPGPVAAIYLDINWSFIQPMHALPLDFGFLLLYVLVLIIPLFLLTVNLISLFHVTIHS